MEATGPALGNGFVLVEGEYFSYTDGFRCIRNSDKTFKDNLRINKTFLNDNHLRIKYICVAFSGCHEFPSSYLALLEVVATGDQIILSYL